MSKRFDSDSMNKLVRYRPPAAFVNDRRLSAGRPPRAPRRSADLLPVGAVVHHQVIGGLEARRREQFRDDRRCTPEPYRIQLRIAGETRLRRRSGHNNSAPLAVSNSADGSGTNSNVKLSMTKELLPVTPNAS